MNVIIYRLESHIHKLGGPYEYYNTQNFSVTRRTPYLLRLWVHYSVYEFNVANLLINKIRRVGGRERNKAINNDDDSDRMRSNSY